MSTRVETDYLVIGAGAMGMAFADTLVAETEVTVAIIDRYHQPGGHWNTAYPFVRLHGPSAFYGVNSRPLGNDVIDLVGSNKGLLELASCGEVCSYFGQVMQQLLLPTGRVAYYPMCEYDGEGRFHSVISGETFEVTARRKVVDATYMRVIVPSMRPPAYDVAPGVRHLTPNELVRLSQPQDHCVVIGAGKTGIDVCLWLLHNGVAPADVTWIMPRDPWLIDREQLQPGIQFASAVRARMAVQARSVLAAESIDDLFDRLATSGHLLRLSDDVRPSMYHCASVSRTELAELRRITNVVRRGRVQRIAAETIVLDDGEIATSPSTLHVDCSANGLERRPALPVFDGDRITLQSVRICQQVFSAAFIAYVEATYPDDAAKNHLCAPIPHPDTDIDWLRATMLNGRNQLRWSEHAALQDWLSAARLDGFGRLTPPLPAEAAERDVARRARLDAQQAQVRKLASLLQEVEGVLQ